VLIFLHDPAAALAEMVRVMRPGGHIVVTEADLGSAVVDAPNVELTRTLLATAAEAVPGGWIGRRLKWLLAETGLRDTDVRIFNAPTTNLGEWTRRMGIDPAAARALALGRADARAVEAWRSELQARDAAGRFFAVSSFFMVFATRPHV
jgi:SAM-dependent methyltransferase